MVLMIRERTSKTQAGFCTSAGAAYTQAGGDVNFATGQYILFRMPTSIPKGSTVNSAVLRLNHNAKNDQAQTCYNSVRAHASGDSPALILGANESSRPWTTARVDQTLVWTVGLPANEMYSTINVKSILDELLSRSDYKSGAYVTFMYFTDNENGSDMGVRMNNDFLPTPKLTVDFTPPTTDVQTNFNMFENSEFSTEALAFNSSGDTNQVPYWQQNAYYGAFVGEAPYLGTMTRDTSFTRLPGIPSLRFTCGQPMTDTGRRTGPMTFINVEGGRNVVFAGWLYIPATIPVSPERVRASDPYLGGQGMTVAGRGVWTPFCTAPMSRGVLGEYHTFYPAIGLNNYQTGWQFWLSEPTFMYSDFPQMPFNGLTPDVLDPGLVTLIDHRSSASKQQAVREWTPRTAVKKSGVLYRAARYIERTDGILQLAEPIKGGPTAPNLPAIAISSYPAGKTISEL